MQSFGMRREGVREKEDLNKRFKALMSYDFQEGLQKMKEALNRKVRPKEKNVSFLLPGET